MAKFTPASSSTTEPWKQPWPFGALTLRSNNGLVSVIAVESGPVQRLYLKRLVRQDETGIWSVVGYGPR